jgi:hypothetical protein
MLQEAGGFAYGLQWLGERLLKDQGVDEVRQAFRREMQGHIFTPWWQGLTPREQALLKGCARPGGLEPPKDEQSQMHLAELKDRCLVIEQAGCFRSLPGEAWKEFLQRVH